MKTVEAKNISKKYLFRKESSRTLKSTVLDLLRKRGVLNDLWALRDVNFSVDEGETLGIIGANGAGKSTLLGIIAGTITPTQGDVTVNGRMSTLLELGAGFHPDLTARENIFLNGSIMGLTKKAITEKFDDIVDFAGLSQFIDMPVKHYSSGMYVRLGFSVAVQLDPDILIVDEVLAVGDEVFKKKCLAQMARFKEQKKTILVVSHDLETVKKICDRVILLGEGKMIRSGDPGQVVEEYKRLGLQQQDNVAQREWGTRQATIKEIKFLNTDGVETTQFNHGDTITAKIIYEAREKILDPIFGFDVKDFQGKLCYGSNTIVEDYPIESIEGDGTITLTFSTASLLRGKFFFSVSLHSRDHQTNYHRLDNIQTFWITSKSAAEGFVDMPCKWQMR